MRRRNNKKAKLIKILLTVTLVIVGVIIGSIKVFTSKGNEQIIAKVNKENIYKSEVNTKLKEMFRSDITSKVEINSLPPEMLEMIVKDIYAEKELDKKIKQEKLAKNKEIKKKIDDYAKRITRQAYLESILKKAVNDETVKAKYSDLKTELNGKKEVHLKHIVVKTKEEAEKILGLLKAKKPKTTFEDLARKYSIDKANSKDGGDLGYILEDSLAKEFTDITSTMKNGSISSPIQTQFGWHILKMVDSKIAEALPFESVKTNIEEELKRKELEKFFAGFTNNAKVEILIELKKPEAKTDSETKAEPGNDAENKTSEKENDSNSETNNPSSTETKTENQPKN